MSTHPLGSQPWEASVFETLLGRRYRSTLDPPYILRRRTYSVHRRTTKTEQGDDPTVTVCLASFVVGSGATIHTLGVSKRDPRDDHDPEVGMKLAYRQAVLDAAAAAENPGSRGAYDIGACLRAMVRSEGGMVRSTERQAGRGRAAPFDGSSLAEGVDSPLVSVRHSDP